MMQNYLSYLILKLYYTVTLHLGFILHNSNGVNIITSNHIPLAENDRVVSSIVNALRYFRLHSRMFVLSPQCQDA